MNDHVVSEVAGGVQTIRFDRVEAQNRLNAAMCEATADALALAESSSRVRAILITGTPGIFTAGQDTRDLHDAAERGIVSESTVRLMKTLATLEKPIVASVDGMAAGIGTTLLLHCDYVIASEWSTFSAGCSALGLAPEAAASLLAPRLMGYHNAFGLLILGEQLEAERAWQVGLVNRVVEASAVEAAGREAAEALARMPPEAVRMARRLMRGDRREVVARIDQEAAGFVDLLRSPAARDALMAYIDAER